MVTKKFASTTKYAPTSDAGLGLVYRLNRLWATADYKSLAGDFDGWNFVLDRIYCNLSYREKLELQEQKETGKIINFKMQDQNVEIYNIFKNRIRKAKIDFYNAMKKKNGNELAEAREEHYQALMDKDMWLRKFMTELGLYLKEHEYNPATALFGGG